MKTLGEFGPGDVPVVYDPIYTGNRTPRATLVHEGTHQSLVVNSAYGLFFQVLSKLASRGEHVQEYHLCLSDQWSIQELTATYREMCYVADSQPDQLDEAIRALPTAVLGQPPYRELFDCVDEYLPVRGLKGAGRRFAHQCVVLAIAGCSFNNDCLVRFSHPQVFDFKAFCSFLETNSPHLRFEKIFGSLIENRFLDQLVESAQAMIEPNERSSEERRDPVPQLLQTIPAVVPSIKVFSWEEVQRQAELFEAEWRTTYQRLTGSTIVFGKNKTDPLPAIVEPDEKHERTRNRFPKQWPLTPTNLREQFQTAREKGKGIWASFAMRREEEIFVQLVSYPLGEGKNPPSYEAVREAFHAGGGFRLGGPIGTNEVFAVLEEFPELPQAVTFWMSSWRNWDQVAVGRSVLTDSVLVCVQADLSLGHLTSLLEFRNLGKSAEFFLIRYGEDAHAVCFADPGRPGVYALQNVATSAGRDLFSLLAPVLGLRQLSNPRAVVPHVPLLELLPFIFLQPGA